MHKCWKVWETSFAIDIRRLSHGIRYVKGINIVVFIIKYQVLVRRSVTYGQIVVEYIPHKMKPQRIRLNVGGDRVNYPWDMSTPTADLITCQIIVNSTISTPGAKFFTIMFKNLS